MKTRSGAALCLTLLACRSAAPPREQTPLELADAELRSDVLDLPFLLAHGHLDPGGFVLPGTPGDPIGSRGPVSRVTLPLGSRSDKELRLQVRGRSPGSPPLDVSLNGTAIGALPLGSDPTEATFPLPASAQQDGENTLRLGSPGGRKAWALVALDVRPAGTGRTSPPGPEGDAWWLPAGASADLYLHVAPDTALSLAAEAGNAGARLAVTLEGDGLRRTLADLALGPAEARTVLAAVEAPPGAYVRLRLACAGPGGVRIRRAERGAARSPAASPLAPQRLAGRPSVIVFLVDTLRADALGAYGETAPTSPRFDAFARDALLFEDAGAQASWTEPAVASIFTGLHPGSHGVSGLGSALVPGITTLAESLAAAGYRTGAFVANPAVNVRFGFAQGFSAWNPGASTLNRATSDAVVDRALRWVDEGPGPLFLYVHTLDPHAPYEPTAADGVLFEPPGYTGERRSPSLLARAHLEAGELAYLRSLYLAELRGSDRAFGALLDGLRRRGLLEDSVVVFTADHGEEFQDHGGLQHAYTLYRELLRIPLAVRLPHAQRGGAKVAAPVDQIDLFPTLARLVGAGVPEVVEGRDLSAAWLLGSSVPDPPARLAETAFGRVRKRAIRTGSLKLIANDDARYLWRAGSARELYDLAADPGETRDVAGARPLVAGYLAQLTRAARREQQAVRVRLAAGATQDLSAAEQEELRALGYIR